MFKLASAPRKRNLFTRAVESLGSRIVRGELKPGDTLPNESDLAQELGASRTVVREAVKALAAKGLLEARTRIGTRVLESIHWNLLDPDVLGWRYAAMPRTQFFLELFEIRRMIEPSAAELAAGRATPADIAAIEQAFAAMMTVDVNAAGDAAIEADLRFHRAVLAAAHNELLAQMGGLIGVGLVASYRISSESYGAGLPRHRQVLDAIRARRPTQAREAMEQLLLTTRELLESGLADSA